MYISFWQREAFVLKNVVWILDKKIVCWAWCNFEKFPFDAPNQTVSLFLNQRESYATNSMKFSSSSFERSLFTRDLKNIRTFFVFSVIIIFVTWGLSAWPYLSAPAASWLRCRPCDHWACWPAWLCPPWWRHHSEQGELHQCVKFLAPTRSSRNASLRLSIRSKLV